MSMMAAVAPWTPQAMDLGPPLRSTMMVSASGMTVAARMIQPRRVVEIGSYAVAGGRGAGCDEESCADDDDGNGDKAGQHVADGGQHVHDEVHCGGVDGERMDDALGTKAA
jgi:hypothetical protein